MTRDTILGWLLIFLVGASLFLSFFIWYQTPGPMQGELTQVNDAKLDLASVLGPEKIQVRFGDSTHTLLRPSSSYYSEVWSLSRELLTDQWSNVGLEALEDSWWRKQGVVANFPTPLPVSALRKLVDAKPVETSSLEGKLIRSFIMTIEDEKLVAYLEDDGGNFHKFSKHGDPQALKALLKELANSRPPLYARLPSEGKNLIISNQVYVSLLSYELPAYSLGEEAPPGERQVSEYFSDFSVVRKIEEKDGAVIYTDGQRGLRVYEDGAIEYSFPGDSEAGKCDFYDSLMSVVNFVNRHGGWPKNVYLASYEKLEAGKYAFRFRVRINGYPLVGGEDFLTVEVTDTRISRLHRRVFSIDGQIGIKDLDTPIKALDIAVAVKNIRQIDDIYPAYLIQGEELLPRWVVETGGMEVVLPTPLE